MAGNLLLLNSNNVLLGISQGIMHPNSKLRVFIEIMIHNRYYSVGTIPNFLSILLESLEPKLTAAITA